MNVLDIRPARPDELSSVEGLWLEASRWLASRGLDQWQYPPRRYRMIEAIRARDCHLVHLHSRLVGTITVQEEADPEWWADDDPSCALYVHDLAVSRSAAGKAVGAALLDWAGGLAARRGKPWLRLEAWKTNHLLHRYYLAQRFELLRIEDLPHRNSGALFQRHTGFVTAPASVGGDTRGGHRAPTAVERPDLPMAAPADHCTVPIVKGPLDTAGPSQPTEPPLHVRLANLDLISRTSREVSG